MPISRLAPLVQKRRGERGLREAAAEIGISPATLSRVERGKLPDIETFSKLCTWLKVDPSEILGVQRAGPRTDTASATTTRPAPAVHFRAKSALSPQAAKDLAQLILAAQDEMARRGFC
jgi:transcriptional regulator with XRE-family HTH domain